MNPNPHVIPESGVPEVEQEQSPPPLTVLNLEPPMELLQTVTADRARRWGYDKTLDQEDLAACIREMAEKDADLRADAAVVWRFAGHHFAGRSSGEAAALRADGLAALTTLRAYLTDIEDSFLQSEHSAIFEALGKVEAYVRDGAR